MKIKIKYFLLIVISLINFIYPQINLKKSAQSTMNFLLVSTSPKASGMGEAYTTIGVGSEAMFYNPAGLTAMQNQFDINVNYTRWIADINYMSGGIAWNFDNYGVVGINLLTVDYGTINGTSLISAAEADLYPLGYKDNGPVGNVGAYSIGLSYAKSVSREFSIGGTIKLAGQNLGESVLANGTKKNKGTVLAFDAGVKYLTDFKGFSFGMSIRNFSSDIKREEMSEQLPLIFSLGVSMNLMDVIDDNLSKNNSVVIAADFLHQNNYSERINLGIEYKFLQMLALRGGYQTNRDLASWSGGVGFNTSVSDYNLEVNYSYSKFEIFDSISRLSLLFGF